MKCTKCGADDWTLVSQVGALETWRCNVCSNEELRHLNFVEPLAAPGNREPVLEVAVRWLEKPTAPQVAELQGLFPRLRKLSAVEIMKQARSESSVAVGRFKESELAPLRPKLDALGVSLALRPIA